MALPVDRLSPLRSARNTRSAAVARSRRARAGAIVPLHLGGGDSVVLHARVGFTPRVLRIWVVAGGRAADRPRRRARGGTPRRVVISAPDDPGGDWCPRRR